MVERKEYLDQLWAWKDEQQIKVVTGIRRCGKSVLLEQYQQRLLANGVTSEQIISINFENLDYEPLKDYMKLYNYLKERLCADKMTYIFLDEVQEVPSFEKVVDSLYIRDHVDVYITGSNAYMLSSELATLLSGRYTEIKMLPLSFREYMVVTGMAKEEAFAEFMKTGGIPYVAVMNRTDEKIDQYLEGIYNTVIVKDIEQRQARREKEGGKRKITDIALLKTIARYLASVIGSPVSMKSRTDYLTSAGRKVSQNTVSNYVVYLELSRRGGKVNIGKCGSTEVDFVTQKEGVLTYYQVTADMTAEETFEREMRPLRSIQDNYEKIVLTLDRFSLGNYDGIKVVNVIDWLLG